MPTIEDVIRIYEEHFNFKVDDNGNKYKGFLERQLQAHDEYDLEFERKGGGRGRGITKYPWVNLLVDKLLSSSYVIGETSIIVDKEGTERRIGRYEDGSLKPINERSNDLILLSVKSIGVNIEYKENRTDKRLLHLYLIQNNRRYSPTFREKFQNWQSLINEIGGDPIIINYFGRKISYKDVSQHFPVNSE